MTQMMKKLFALLMAVMMLCASLPLNALAELVPSAPIEEHSQSAWMYSALGDVAPISLGDSMDDHINEGTPRQENPEFDIGFGTPVVRVLINGKEYNESSEVEKVSVDTEVEFTIKVNSYNR